MIYSILDTDLYKFSTSYAYMKLYPEAEGTFSFCDRNKVEFNDGFVETLKIEIAKLSAFEYVILQYLNVNFDQFKDEWEENSDFKELYTNLKQIFEK